MFPHTECQAVVEGFKLFHKANVSIFLFPNKDLVLARQIQVILLKRIHILQAWRKEGLLLTTTSNEAAKMFDATVTQVS